MASKEDSTSGTTLAKGKAARAVAGVGVLHSIGRNAPLGSALESRISPLRGVLNFEWIILVMARKARVDFAGAVYHVLDRGDRREAIFKDDTDRRRFLETLGEACARTGWRVHANRV